MKLKTRLVKGTIKHSTFPSFLKNPSLYAIYSKLSIDSESWSSITSQIPAKILVVDDDVDNGLLLKDFLQISGFDVDVYFSSEEASENFQCGEYIF